MGNGLARAFFFAGAPTLLVSHWDDRATRALMTQVFDRYAKDPALSQGRARVEDPIPTNISDCML